MELRLDTFVTFALAFGVLLLMFAFVSINFARRECSRIALQPTRQKSDEGPHSLVVCAKRCDVGPKCHSHFRRTVAAHNCDPLRVTQDCTGWHSQRLTETSRSRNSSRTTPAAKIDKSGAVSPDNMLACRPGNVARTLASAFTMARTSSVSLNVNHDVDGTTWIAKRWQDCKEATWLHVERRASSVSISAALSITVCRFRPNGRAKDAKAKHHRDKSCS